MNSSTDKYQRIVNDLIKQGWSISENFINAEVAQALKNEADALHENGAFRRAGVGREQGYHVESKIRGDNIVWLDEVTDHDAPQRYLAELEQLRQVINQQMFLGLFEFEGHFAVYGPGTFYQRHLDQHQGSDSRQVTCVMYMNEHWQPEHRGELRLFVSENGNERAIDIPPRAGLLACFLSEMFYHEVLPTTTDRYSITGWFRRRG
ncbi:MAG: 2OG-Fe(II) oxygenase [Gammaproteobacteria bacterium]|nr:2OG-Fe(II) oxygenase [Gammaproteobacteria bacterium]